MTIRIKVTLSDQQKAALERAARAAGIEQAEVIRRALKIYLDRFPDDLPRRGEYERNKPR